MSHEVKQADSPILEGLNDAQREAVTHGSGPLLIVAGAGTGKTTVLARRYRWLLEQGSKTDNILALTFTEKAAEEMETRVLESLPTGAYDFWISTFHGFCQRLLEEHALEIGLPNSFRVITDTDAWLMLKQRIHDLPLDIYRPLGNPTKFLKALLQHISRAKDEGVTAETYLEFAENCALDGDAEYVTGERSRLNELGNLYFAYQKMLRDEGCLDFGDLILEALRLLHTRPNVLKQAREQFRNIFVDEFQDTNWAQYELVKLIAGEAKNLTVVGDDDQAIYKFRGASLANILQFRDDFPEAEVVTLTQNYRSHQEILDAAYTSIQNNNPYRLESQLAEIEGKKKLQAAKGEGGAVQTKWYATLEDEATGVAKTIAELRRGEPDFNWSDVAILVRSNRTATPFLNALDRHGIPFQFSANRGLYSKPFILDVISLLTLCVDPHDSRHMWRALCMDSVGIPLDARAKLLHATKRDGVSLWDAAVRSRELRLPEPVSTRIEKLLSGIRHVSNERGKKAVLQLLHDLIKKTGVLDDVLKRPEAERKEIFHLVRTFSDRVERYESMVHDASLKTFLDDLRMEIESGDEGSLSQDPDIGPDFVNVMTIHAAKGLEFRHVFCVALVDQRFPTRKRSDAIPLPEGLISERLPEEENTHLSEERRLFYVAMTRAKESITLTGAESYGGTRKKRASCFLDEVGEEREEIARMNHLVDGDAEIEFGSIRSAEIQAFQLKRRFSFTQLAAFKTCPLQYKFAHVYKIPIVGSEQKSFGQAIHKTLHDILSRHRERGMATQADLFSAPQDVSTPTSGLRVPKEEAETIYEERWGQHAYWFSSPERKKEFYTNGKAAVRLMWDTWNASPPDIEALERPFTWKIGEHTIRGSIDRMDRHPDGGVIVYDYKTGKAKTSKELQKEQKQQLHIYQLALEALGIPVKGLSYIYVLTGDMAEVPVLEGDKKVAFTEDLLESMQGILKSDFPPNPSEFACKFCDFRDICEFRSA